MTQQEVEPPANQAPTPLQFLAPNVATLLGAVLTFVRKWFWQLFVAALVLAFIVCAVRPFERSADPTAEDVAQAWNGSIARLGILPVFPPEEDLHVGDLWAVIADSEETPLLGKAVRIAHLDIRKEILDANKRRPIFTETVDLKAGEQFRRQDRKEIDAKDDDRIGLTLTSFPGITISHKVQTGASLGSTFGGLGAARDDQQFEEIRIPTAETYGVPALVGFLQLDKWCADEKTKIYCSDEFARRILAFGVSDRVLATKDGTYITRLQLRLVTRVFLTREIEHRRQTTGSRGGKVQTPGESSKAGVALEGGTASPDASKGAPAVPAPGAGASAGAGNPVGSASVNLSRGDQTELALHQVFQRPVAFGFRAITISLTPSMPAKELPK